MIRMPNNEHERSIEEGLLRLVNDELDTDLIIGKYQRVFLMIYDQMILKSILDECKFKDVGSVYDYPGILPQPDIIRENDIVADHNLVQRIAISKKYRAVVHYSSNAYFISCIFLVDVEKLKKFMKKVKKHLQQDTCTNIFKDADFSCGKNEYIEVSDYVIDNKTKPVEVIRKTVPEENLIFDEDSALSKVINEINLFFTDETKRLYEKLQIRYKRGALLHGEPGNGKSAMIRQIIRSLPENIIKVVISPNVINITMILRALTQALNGKKAIIIIEDMDSFITYENRSEFLNTLDGIDVKSGIYFLATTNYPERIDPAFVNRGGRFDTKHYIGLPSENMRRLYFQSRNIGKLFEEYKVHKDDKIPDTDEGTVELFVKYSEGIPMANVQELITSTAYMLTSNPDMSVEEAVQTCYENIKTNREEHERSHDSYMATKLYRPSNRNKRKVFSYDYGDEDF